MEILEKLNKQFNNKYSFLRVLKVDYNTLLNTAEIWFLYPQSIDDILEEDKKEITNFVYDLLKLSCQIKVKFKKSFTDENLINKHLIEYFKTVYSSMFSYFNNENIKIIKNDENIEINIYLIKNIYDYFIFNNVKIKIIEELNNNFIGNFFVNFYELKDIKLDEEILTKHEEQFLNNLPKQKPVQRYDVYDPDILFGQYISPKPEYIKFQDKEKLSVILAGQVSNLVEKTYISKRNKTKGILTEPSYYYSFTLTDHTGKISAIYFSNKTTYKKARNLKDGDKVLVVGNIKQGQKGLSLHIKSCSLCEIISPKEPESEEEKVEIKQNVHIEEYKVAFPTVYYSTKQENIFDKKPIYDDYALNNEFVVFDCETTGLSCEVDRIIEIGAVKIKNGKIVEQFQTFVNPKFHIPENITGMTTITDEMVMYAPEEKDAITDFYKFCEGSILMGYNVNFDIGFIQSAANRAGLCFENQSFDVLVMAKEKLYLPKYKLINVVEYLGLDLSNAHRAIFDATATAEVFLKLSEK